MVKKQFALNQTTMQHVRYFRKDLLSVDYYKTALKVNYRSDNPGNQTWKSICLKCNTARSLNHSRSLAAFSLL
jgi:hypothetical protein